MPMKLLVGLARRALHKAQGPRSCKPDAPIGDHGAVELGGVRVAVHVARVTPAAYLPVPTVLACARRPRTRTDTALTRTAGAPRARRARASMLPAVQQQGRQPQAGQGVSQGRRHGLAGPVAGRRAQVAGVERAQRVELDASLVQHVVAIILDSSCKMLMCSTSCTSVRASTRIS